MFQLVKLRSDVARMRRHMEEKGQQLEQRGAALAWWASSVHGVKPCGRQDGRTVHTRACTPARHPGQLGGCLEGVYACEHARLVERLYRVLEPRAVHIV